MKKGSRTQFCKKGHNKDIVGRTKNGGCAQCAYEYRQEHSVELKRYKIEYYKHNREEIKRKSQKYRVEHVEELKLKRKKYYLDNIEKRKQYNQDHKKQRNERDNKYFAERLKTDIQFKLRSSLRSRLLTTIKKNYKAGSAVKDLGCSIEFLKTYLEAKFYNGMTWDNWGKLWQLDHIKELHTFDLTNREAFLKAVHYTNLQPLTIEDHKKKTIINSKI